MPNAPDAQPISLVAYTEIPRLWHIIALRSLGELVPILRSCKDFQPVEKRSVRVQLPEARLVILQVLPILAADKVIIENLFRFGRAVLSVIRRSVWLERDYCAWFNSEASIPRAASANGKCRWIIAWFFMASGSWITCFQTIMMSGSGELITLSRALRHSEPAFARHSGLAPLSDYTGAPLYIYHKRLNISDSANLAISPTLATRVTSVSLYVDIETSIQPGFSISHFYPRMSAPDVEKALYSLPESLPL